jgi:DNA-binding SARP family transcriptional activator
LKRSVEAHPYDRSSLAELVSLYERSGDPAEALNYARRLAELEPADPQVQQTLRMLEAQLQGK